MKPCTLFTRQKGNMVQCTACAHYCQIPDGKAGFCGVRKNERGTLFLEVYGKPIGCHIDPIEKKPLFHFLPGSKVFSFGTLGCNFGCEFCQNWDMSQAPRIVGNNHYCSMGDPPEWSPERIVAYCVKNHIPTIAYTYNEPTIFAEYFLDIARLAKEKGIKNVMVSNGFFSIECFEAFKDSIDAINIDLKGFSDAFYKKVCKAHVGERYPPAPLIRGVPKAGGALLPVAHILNNIRRCFEAGIWTEVTTLVIPGYNDDDKTLAQCARAIAEISPSIPWHISAFYPAFKMMNTPPTPPETLLRAAKIGKSVGAQNLAPLKYVYTGNIRNGEENTHCPKCESIVIERNGYTIEKINLEDGKCGKCGEEVEGRWG